MNLKKKNQQIYRVIPIHTANINNYNIMLCQLLLYISVEFKPILRHDVFDVLMFIQYIIFLLSSSSNACVQ